MQSIAMKFGICASQSKAAEVAAIGYDYIELTVAGDLQPEQRDWSPPRLPLPVEAFNVFMGSVPVVGPSVDTDRLQNYVMVAFARARDLGAAVIVFGSGGARRVPTGFDKLTAEAQLRGFIAICAEACAETGVELAIEPLNREETNTVNSIKDAIVLAKAPGVGFVADTYHMQREMEPLSAIDRAHLLHVHTADDDRRAPGSGQYDHVALFKRLRAIGYDGRVSIECGWGDDFEAEAESALSHLRSAAAIAAVQAPGLQSR